MIPEGLGNVGFLARHALPQLFLGRIRLFLREPDAVFWSFGFPIILAVALGIAFRQKGPDKVYVGIEAGGEPGLVERALTTDSSLSVAEVSPDEGARELRSGKVALVAVPGEPIRFRFDPTRPESRVARLAVSAALDKAAGRPVVYAVEDVAVTERGSRYIDWLIPGLIGMNIMSASMWGIGYSIVEQRGKKLLKRLAATPMSRPSYLWAYILGHVVLITFMLLVILLFARIAFGVTCFGSWLAYYAVSIAGAMGFAGLGLAVSSRTEKTETLGGMMNAVMLPMFVGSGVFFSYEHFPAVLQPVIRALPLTALNDALRAIAIDGASLWQEWPRLAVLAVWGVVSFVIALRLFRWA